MDFQATLYTLYNGFFRGEFPAFDTDPLFGTYAIAFGLVIWLTLLNYVLAIVVEHVFWGCAPESCIQPQIRRPAPW